MSDRPVRAVSYRTKLLVFVLAALAVLVLIRIAYSALETISSLKVIEAERDQWQRPSDVIRELGAETRKHRCRLWMRIRLLHTETLPSGGQCGRRDRGRYPQTLPLVFLWVRAAEIGGHNVKVVVGETTNPHLPKRVDAVLISNTYHEFADAHSILAHVYASLVPGGLRGDYRPTAKSQHGCAYRRSRT